MTGSSGRCARPRPASNRPGIRSSARMLLGAQEHPADLLMRHPGRRADPAQPLHPSSRASAIAADIAEDVTSSSITRSSASRRSRTAGANPAISRENRSTSDRRNATPSESATPQDWPGHTQGVNGCDSKPGSPVHSYWRANSRRQPASGLAGAPAEEALARPVSHGIRTSRPRSPPASSRSCALAACSSG